MKPVILGLNNPHSSNPIHALRPHPKNSAGYRLARMFLEEAERTGTTLSFQSYEDGFERINILNETEWNRARAKALAPCIMDSLKSRKLICCGKEVARLLGLKIYDWGWWHNNDTVEYCVIPHPSGLTREYNYPTMRRAVGKLLLGLYMETGNGGNNLQVPMHEAGTEDRRY